MTPGRLLPRRPAPSAQQHRRRPHHQSGRQGHRDEAAAWRARAVRRQRLGNHAAARRVDAALLAQLLGAYQESLVDRAVRVRLALELAQPYRGVARDLRGALEHLELDRELLLAGPRPREIVARGLGDAL